MKRIFIITVLVGFAILFLSELVSAQTLTNFNNTIEKLEISRDGGKTYFTVFENNNTSIDLVAINGQNVGTFMGNALVPAGRYNKYRVRISDCTIVFGNLNCCGGPAGGTLNITSNQMGGAIPRTETGDMNITITDGGTVNGVINFDAATSYSGFTYTWNGVAYILTGLTFNPNITVVSE